MGDMPGQTVAATIKAVALEWSAVVTGGPGAALLFIATVIVTLVASNATGATQAQLTTNLARASIGFVVGSLVVAAVSVAHRERVSLILYKEQERQPRPSFDVQISVAGFSAENTEGFSDAVAWMKITNRGAAGAIRSISMWSEREGNRVFGIDRLSFPRRDDADLDLIDEEWALLQRITLGRTVIGSGDSVEGAVQFAIPGQLGSFDITTVRASCESEYTGPFASAFTSGAPRLSYGSVEPPMAPSHIITLVNNGNFHADPGEAKSAAP